MDSVGHGNAAYYELKAVTVAAVRFATACGVVGSSSQDVFHRSVLGCWNYGRFDTDVR